MGISDGHTIIEGSPKTAFVYRIDGGMDERDKDEIESMDSGYVLGRNWPAIVSDSVDLRHRMTYIRHRNLGFSFIELADKDFEKYLKDIDPDLPITLAYIVADFYRNGTQRLSDLIENVSMRNPASLPNISERKPYESMITRFITAIIQDEPPHNILDNVFLGRIPADRYGCASISGDKISGYRTSLVLQMTIRV